MPPNTDESQITFIVPIALDAETRELLARFSAAVKRSPSRVAADLLRDLLRDDDEAHRPFN